MATPRHDAGLRGLLLAGLSGLVYLTIAGSFLFEFKQTDHPHHILMADALLHGQLSIRPEAEQFKLEQLVREESAKLDEYARRTGHVLTRAERDRLLVKLVEDRTMSDWAVYHGRLYGYWAPLAALVALPFVAIWGPGISDQLINVLLGTMNVGLFYWLLVWVQRAGLCRLDESCRVALALLLAFGTSLFWQTCVGEVWFAVQVVTLTAMLAAMIAACSPGNRPASWLASGALFGCAILGRNIVILAGLFFVVLIWVRLRQAGAARARPFAVRLALFCPPVIFAVALQGAYNYARFGDVWESGLGIQVHTGGQERFVAAYDQYGTFSPHYLPHNLKYYFWNYDFPRLNDRRIWFDSEGNSMFLATPPLLYIFVLWRRRSWLALALGCGVVPLLAALLLYFATGFVQFGPRYLLDVMPMLLLLAAIGMRGRLTHVGYVLIVLAIAANLFGTYRICQREFIPVSGLVGYWTLPALVAIALLGRMLAIWRRRRRQVVSA